MTRAAGLLLGALVLAGAYELWCRWCLSRRLLRRERLADLRLLAGAAERRDALDEFGK